MNREHEGFYPNEENIGKNCSFWSIEMGCIFPKKEMEGRRSCEGIVDDVCLWLKNRKHPKSLTPEQLLELKLRVPSVSPLDIPPGDTQVQTSPLTQSFESLRYDLPLTNLKKL